MLTRRGFFGLLGGAVAAEVAKPVIRVFAPAGGWKASESGIYGLSYGQTAIHTGTHGGIARTMYRGHYTGLSLSIDFVDFKTNTIWFVNPLPKGVRKGDLLILDGNHSS